MGITEEKYFIEALKSGLYGTPVLSPPAQMDCKVFFDLCAKHACEVIVFYALSPLKPLVDEKLFTALQNRAKLLSMKDVKQNFEMDRILDEFEKNCIKCMPLKGYYVRNLYLKTEMRYLSDFDVLVDLNKLEMTRTLMPSLGFEKEKYDEHHDCYINKNNGVCVELHKKLIVGKLAEYFGIGFERAYAKQDKEYIFELDKNDEYIFILGHMCYHFAQGGIGARSVADVRMFLDKYENELNREYIENELKKCGLYKIANQIEKLSRVWFLNETSDEMTDRFGRYVLESGMLGNAENRKNVEIAKQHSENMGTAKFKAVFRIIFPTMQNMKFLYPFLKKMPFLVPFAFADRWLKVLFGDKKRLKRLSGAVNADDEIIEDLKKLYSALDMDKI